MPTCFLKKLGKIYDKSNVVPFDNFIKLCCLKKRIIQLEIIDSIYFSINKTRISHIVKQTENFKCNGPNSS